MKIAFQVVFSLFSVIGSLQKQKWAMLLCYIISNIFCTCMYFVFDRLTAACLCIVATVRLTIYFIFAIKKIKPNIFILIFFELAFVVSTILTWKEAIDLLVLFALIVSCYASWQDNTLIIRIGYIINPALYIIYNSIIGAYIAALPDIIMFVSSSVALLYYDILKKERPILSYFYKKKSLQPSDAGDDKSLDLNEINEKQIDEIKNEKEQMILPQNEEVKNNSIKQDE